MRATRRTGITLHPMDLTRSTGMRDLDVLDTRLTEWARARGLVENSWEERAPYLSLTHLEIELTRRHLLSQMDPRVEERVTINPSHPNPVLYQLSHDDPDGERWWREIARRRDTHVSAHQIDALCDELFPAAGAAEQQLYAHLTDPHTEPARVEILTLIRNTQDATGADIEELTLASEILTNEPGDGSQLDALTHAVRTAQKLLRSPG